MKYMTMREQIVATLNDGPMNLVELVTEMGLSPGTLYLELSDLEALGKVFHETRTGLWGMVR